ncbi:MAG: hypothetical protein JO197_17280 [Acidobacteria bacterium]|nr:hypothetical protein [Acidobacteriota bacterium]MBV9478423.1 hypothetical protein [Acidobacteriota bacterium]
MDDELSEGPRSESDAGFADERQTSRFSYAELDRRVRVLERALVDLQSRVERLEASTH